EELSCRFKIWVFNCVCVAIKGNISNLCVLQARYKNSILSSLYNDFVKLAGHYPTKQGTQFG
ncbi:MAG: hypothetical protein PWK00_01670, partial [Coxiella burnetii]|nr:hypothetical protein [Coxiella burnetii]